MIFPKVRQQIFQDTLGQSHHNHPLNVSPNPKPPLIGYFLTIGTTISLMAAESQEI